jgi:ClpP class serine protease
MILTLQTILLMVAGFIVLCIAGYYIWKRVEKRVHLEEFKKSVESGYTDFERAYTRAHIKLSDDFAVIELVHDWSDNSLGPAGLPDYITDDQAFEIVRQIKKARDVPIAVILHTIGGYSHPSYLIAKALHQYKGGPVTAFVPYLAMSGGTAIALAAHEIVMGETASLGPIDTQYWGLPIGAFDELEKKKDANEIDDIHIMLAYVARTFEAKAGDRAKRHINDKHAKTVAQALMDPNRYHGDGISKDEATAMGINIAKGDCPQEVYDLVDAKLRMVAIERARIAKEALNLPTQHVERTQQLQAFNDLKQKAKRLRAMRSRRTG